MSEAATTITAVEPLGGHWLRLTFADGAIHELDLGPTLALGGVFTPIYEDRAIFEAVAVDPGAHTIAWPGEVDLDPYVLRGIYETADEVPLARRVIAPV